MSVAPKGRRANPSPRAILAVCTRLLADHERAAAAGAPLWTEAGIAHLRRLVNSARAGRSGSDLWSATGPVYPRWDGSGLWLDGEVLKEFGHDAPAQVAIVTAFQDQSAWARGWVDDPLPPEDKASKEEARQRLYNAVANLNRRLKPGTIHFRVVGTKVKWEYTSRRRKHPER